MCIGEREATRIESSLSVYQKTTPTKLVTVEVGQTQAKQNVPGWIGFHAIVTVNNSRPTRIGFPRMIPSPVKESNTVYTCLKEKSRQDFPREQNNAVVTFDEGIYRETKRVQWANSPKLDNSIKHPLSHRISVPHLLLKASKLPGG